MKKLFKNFTSLALVAGTIALATLSSCSDKMTFTKSSVVPAAAGYVNLKSDKNDNHTIKININHLAPATQLSPPYETYVVWMVTPTNETKNIGQLKSSSGFMSKALKGSLSAVSPFKPTAFFITAENKGNVDYPGMIVLSTN